MTLDDRIDLLAASGVDDVIVLRFDRQFSRRSADEFLHDLVERLDMRTLVTGPNAAIGRDREGTPDVIASLAPRLGFTHLAVRYEGEPGAISSTKGPRGIGRRPGGPAARRFWTERTVSLAPLPGAMVGAGSWDFQRPTSKLLTWLVLPADGVYAGSALVDGDPMLYPALVSVGTRPTFSSSARLFEVHLLGFDREIYGCGLRTFIRAWLRGQELFPSAEELVTAMRRDREAAETMELGGSEQAIPFLQEPG